MSEDVNSLSDLKEVFFLLAKVAKKDGSQPMKDIAGCWERKIPGVDGGTWRWAVNGHETPQSPSWSPIQVPPYHCYLEWCGWPAGLFTPFEGEICAGSMANEDNFIAALNAELERRPT